jgi:chromate transporter
MSLPASPDKAPGKQIAGTLLKLFWTTLKIGAFTFGGGYAMLPLMEREFCRYGGWICHDEMLDIMAVAQTIPGAIAVNVCVIAGYRICRVKGAIAAVIGVALPSLIVLSAITVFYQQFSQNIYVTAALKGISAAVVALLVSATARMSKGAFKDALTWIIAAAAFAMTLVFGVNAMWLILGGVALGIVAALIRRRRTRT